MKEWLASRSSMRVVTSASAKATADSLPEKPERRLVTLTFTSWNQLDQWLRQVEELRRAA